MFKYIKKLKNVYDYIKSDEKNTEHKAENTPFSLSLEDNLNLIKSRFDNSADLTIKRLRVKNIDAAILTLEGMTDGDVTANGLINPILRGDYSGLSDDEIFDYIANNVIASSDQKITENFESVYVYLASGFAILLIDKVNKGLVIGVQGFSHRGVDDPANEISQNGSREGFVEPIKINMSLIRRRLKTPKLKFENMKIGVESPTAVSLCYLRDKVSKPMLREVRKRLLKIDLPTVLASGYVMPYLAEKGEFSLFSGCYISERPDTVCAKIAEGRIGIIIDGTPSVITVPYLFVEYFQNMDDYISRPYYATFLRWLRYLAFFVATILPGFYVAAGTFNPELFPEELLDKIAVSIATRPFPLMLEALVIHLMYEVVREAGLRLPKTLGHAISIVGGLVIGDSAVKSGLIGDTTLMILALTAISSYIIPNLYEPIAILRLIFIVVGGIAGVWGIMLLFSVVLLNLCSKKSFGVPFMSPITPFSLFGMRDVLIRAGWKTLAKKNNTVANMVGSSLKEE